MLISAHHGDFTTEESPITESTVDAGPLNSLGHRYAQPRSEPSRLAGIRTISRPTAREVKKTPWYLGATTGPNVPSARAS